MTVVERLKKHILVDGYHVVLDSEKSHGSWIVDRETGREYLDCYSQFASQPLGWNHYSLKEFIGYVQEACMHKIANSDMYSEVYCDFVETFAEVCPDFKHFFFIEGGTLAVENALKAAFDWKCQVDPRHQPSDGRFLDVIHFKEAFHGRSGYTLSLTNTGDLKTKWFPKFNWTRVTNPKMHGDRPVEQLEQECLNQMTVALKTGNVAAIVFETIQGEGGNHLFRPEFFKAVRGLADQYQALLVFDEVQSGMGITGKWWAYEHYGIVPDLMVFGKKTQVCGFCSTDRIESAPEHVFKQSGRINSTWGGNIVDFARATVIIDIMRDEELVEQAALVGAYFKEQLETLPVTNVRGKGLMLAFSLPNASRRDEVIKKMQENMMVLKSGEDSIRFRPCLTFTKEDVDQAMVFIKESL